MKLSVPLTKVCVSEVPGIIHACRVQCTQRCCEIILMQTEHGTVSIGGDRTLLVRDV